MTGMTHENQRHLIPFDTIAAAAAGDEEAICAVVKHYDRYITKLACRERTDADGIQRMYVDDELKCRMITKLITGILQFRVDRED